jgi:hypothetical protein
MPLDFIIGISYSCIQETQIKTSPTSKLFKHQDEITHLDKRHQSSSTLLNILIQLPTFITDIFTQRKRTPDTPPELPNTYTNLSQVHKRRLEIPVMIRSSIHIVLNHGQSTK